MKTWCVSNCKQASCSFMECINLANVDWMHAGIIKRKPLSCIARVVCVKRFWKRLLKSSCCLSRRISKFLCASWGLREIQSDWESDLWKLWAFRGAIDRGETIHDKLMVVASPCFCHAYRSPEVKRKKGAACDEQICKLLSPFLQRISPHSQACYTPNTTCLWMLFRSSQSLLGSRCKEGRVREVSQVTADRYFRVPSRIEGFRSVSWTRSKSSKEGCTDYW